MPEAREQREEPSSRGSFLKSAIQGLGMFLFVQFIISQFFGNKQAGPTGSKSVPNFEDRPESSSIENYQNVPAFVSPIWATNSSLDISIYTSPYLRMPPLSSMPEDSLVLEEKDFVMGDWEESREIDTTFKVPKEVQNNGTLWAHFYVALAGHQIDPEAQDYSKSSAVHFVRPLNQYLPKKKVAKLKNLLHSGEEGGEEEEEEDNTQGLQFASYYHPNFTVSMIPDSGTINYQTVHPAVRQYVQLESTGARDATGQNGWYYPVLFLNTFWQLRNHMTELNSTVETLPLHISLNNLKNWKFNLYATMDEGMKQTQKQAASSGSMPAGGDGSELETFKEVLLDTNIYLLMTTGIVTVLHMVFEALAFKNDIAHWRQKKDVVGTSLRTILANVFMQAVIFLYLLDNSEGTSWMILAGQGFGIVLEAWKITKTVDVRVRPPRPGSYFAWLPYHIVFEDKHKLSETEQKTKEYDEIAFNWLYIVAVPLLAGYAVYSLLYETHKSWYSYVIETLVGSVYAYGFLMMVPSLYINYRLKSVAHMPGKALMYKFLNTFIDDLFAFTIKMPTLHRIATLRDDIIFFIWLYQGWKYKVDYNRVNEFGQGGEDEKEENEDQASKVEETPDGTDKPESTKASGKKTGTSSARKRK